MLDLAGDSSILEVRMDAPVLGKNVYNRGGGSPIIFVDHAIGSNVLGGSASFGYLNFDDGETMTFNGRNGYGASETSGMTVMTAIGRGRRTRWWKKETTGVSKKANSRASARGEGTPISHSPSVTAIP